jgi:hypothetical protein
VAWVRRFERFFWVAGVLLLAAYLAIRIHGAVLSRRDVRLFERARPGAQPVEILPGERSVDYKLWSPERIRASHETRDDVVRYRIADTRIVRPEDVGVLHATERPTLTLVTCYPFYYVGSAPQRYIIRAVREEGPRTN